MQYGKTSLKDSKTAESSPFLSPTKDTTLLLTPLTVSSDTSAVFCTSDIVTDTED